MFNFTHFTAALALGLALAAATPALAVQRSYHPGHAARARPCGVHDVVADVATTRPRGAGDRSGDGKSYRLLCNAACRVVQPFCEPSDKCGIVPRIGRGGGMKRA